MPSRSYAAAPADDRRAARSLLAELATPGLSDTERAARRERLVQMFLPLVQHLARRYKDRGEPLDDLVQVGTIGLIKAIDRFDPDRGVEFATYATPNILGEIKRHFRDTGWAIRVPRRMQELRTSLLDATAELSQRHGRSPTVSELAAAVGVPEDEVLEGLESAGAYSTLSLDATDAAELDAPSLAALVGSEDEGMADVEQREALRPLLWRLPVRDRQILVLRFFGELTQTQIAERVGISQMHVSRILARTLGQLRADLLRE